MHIHLLKEYSQIRQADWAIVLGVEIRSVTRGRP